MIISVNRSGFHTDNNFRNEKLLQNLNDSVNKSFSTGTVVWNGKRAVLVPVRPHDVSNIILAADINAHK